LNNKVRLLASGAVLFAIALGTSAHAQTTAAAASAAAAGSTIEELVVTAEKRSQSLQDVPVAISAFSSKTRDLIGINSIQDMTNFTPGLNYSSGNDRNSIRGVGRLTNSHPIANAVALYDDGIFSSSTVPAGKTPIFTDRVEVLRGPQGTLYGRNSIGGAINVISRRPTEDPYAEVRATVGNYGRTLVEAAVSGPLAPDLQYRLVGNWEKQSQGYFKNIVPGMPSEGNVIDQYYLEGQLQGKLGDHMDFWGKVDLVGWNNGGGGPGARNSFSPSPFAFQEFGSQNVAAGFACSPGGVVTNVVNTSPLGCTNPASKNPRDFASNVSQSVALDDTYIISFNLSYHFDGFDLKYIGGGENYHYTQITDNGGGSISSFQIPTVSGAPPLTIFPKEIQTYEENFHNVSHELNIASTDNSAFQWLGGLYYYKEGILQPVNQTLPDQPQLAGQILGLTGTPVAADFQNRIFDDRPDMQDESYAVYGQVDWKFASDWKATVGLRWSHDHEFGTEEARIICFGTTACSTTPQLLGSFTPPIDITASQFFTGSVPAGVVNNGHPGGVTFTPDGFAHRSYDGDWSATTGTAGLEWQPDKDTLAYFRYSRGYKQGGFQVGAVAAGGQFPETGPEHMNDYEIGLKKDFGRTLQTNIAIFYYDYEGLQAPLTVTNTSGLLAVNQSVFLNVPKSYSEGVEFESTWAPITNLRILFNYSFNPTGINQLTGIVDPADPEAVQPGAKPLTPLTKCTSASTPLCDVNTGLVQRPQDLKGNVLPNAARNKVALNVLYTWDFAPGSLTPSASYIWRDKEYASIFERDYDSAPSWSQVDARITWKDKDNKYSIIAYVKNMFDTLGYDSANSGTRQSGIFPNAAIAASGGAITPGLPSVAGLSTNGVLTGLGSGGITRSFALTPPRTFGMEFQYRF
jgi:iron complex outermembrane recepter protein